MTIGIKPNEGERTKLDKWYIGIEFLKCPPSQYGIFRPTIYVWCIKWKDFGEPGVFNGAEEEVIGGLKRFYFPYGISINITKF